MDADLNSEFALTALSCRLTNRSPGWARVSRIAAAC